MLLQATITTTGTGIDPWVALLSVVFAALLSAASALAMLRMLNPNAFKAVSEGKKAAAEGSLADAQAVQQRAETLNWLYQRLEELTKQQEILLEKNRLNSTQIDTLKGQNMDQQGQLNELKRQSEAGQLERAAIVEQLKHVYATFDSVVRPAMTFVQDATLRRQAAVRDRLTRLETLINDVREKLDRAADMLWAEVPAHEVKVLLDEANSDLAQLAAQVSEIRDYQDKATQELEDGLRPALDEINRLEVNPRKVKEG